MPQPVDLLSQTSFFSESDFDLKVLDCIAEKRSVADALAVCKAFNPKLIIAQCGSVSYDLDVAFFQEVKKSIPEVKILCSGDAFLDQRTEKLKQHPWLDGIITNFFNDGPLQYFLEKFTQVSGLVYKQEGKVEEADQNRSKKSEMAPPKHHLFKNELYRMPFMDATPLATVLTNYACPFPCTFCIMSTLPFVQRSAKSICDELDALNALGIRYIYFSDQTFFIQKEITNQVLDYMIEQQFNFSWMCFSRVDVLDETRIKKMKLAGCNMIMFGVEWADEAYLEQYKKHYTLDQIRETFRLTKEIGIARLGTFLLGVPGQTEESIINTVNFAIELQADYASFNIAVPRSNTSFRTEALDQGLIDEGVEVMDQSGSFIAMGTGVVSPQRLRQLRNKAYFKFYFRLEYIFDRLAGIKNATQLTAHVREAYYIFKGMI
jgi:anaerobic magnesium-protoporphyrin IX monomethyl ester cyclase